MAISKEDLWRELTEVFTVGLERYKTLIAKNQILGVCTFDELSVLTRLGDHPIVPAIKKRSRAMQLFIGAIAASVNYSDDPTYLSFFNCNECSGVLRLVLPLVEVLDDPKGTRVVFFQSGDVQPHHSLETKCIVNLLCCFRQANQVIDYRFGIPIVARHRPCYLHRNVESLSGRSAHGFKRKMLQYDCRDNAGTLEHFHLNIEWEDSLLTVDETKLLEQQFGWHEYSKDLQWFFDQPLHAILEALDTVPETFNHLFGTTPLSQRLMLSELQRFFTDLHPCESSESRAINIIRYINRRHRCERYPIYKFIEKNSMPFMVRRIIQGTPADQAVMDYGRQHCLELIIDKERREEKAAEDKLYAFLIEHDLFKGMDYRPVTNGDVMDHTLSAHWFSADAGARALGEYGVRYCSFTDYFTRPEGTFNVPCAAVITLQQFTQLLDNVERLEIVSAIGNNNGLTLSQLMVPTYPTAKSPLQEPDYPVSRLDMQMSASVKIALVVNVRYRCPIPITAVFKHNEVYRKQLLTDGGYRYYIDEALPSPALYLYFSVEDEEQLCGDNAKSLLNVEDAAILRNGCRFARPWTPMLIPELQEQEKIIEKIYYTNFSRMMASHKAYQPIPDIAGPYTIDDQPAKVWTVTEGCNATFRVYLKNGRDVDITIGSETILPDYPPVDFLRGLL